MSQPLLVACIDLVGVQAHLVEEGTSALEHHSSSDGMMLQTLHQAIDGLLAQCDNAPRAVSVCLSGLVDPNRGIILDARRVLWLDLPLAEFVSTQYDLPVCVDNEAALIARALDPQGQKRLVVLHSNPFLEVGLALRGQYHHSLELPSVSLLSVLPPAAPPLTCALALRRMGLRRDNADEDALDRLDTLSQDLSEVMFWVIHLLRPAEIWLSGWLSDIGSPLLEQLNRRLLNDMPEHASCSLHLANTDELRLRGAWLHALARGL
ncbi:MAG: ROK family protein [Anaerolineae bacterium]|nr:ROK family protein [Anaerolineae bacterium]MDW8172026.1 ROK family protein [Anaerolineae bacterium]